MKVTKTYTLTVDLSKEPANFTDLLANRIWVMDGVEGVTATEEVQQEYKTESDDAHSHRELWDTIDAFNQLYRLPAPSIPTLMEVVAMDGSLQERITRFQNTLRIELLEGDEISLHERGDDLDRLTELADWYGDICVYAMSEARKFGIPLLGVIAIIMASNMSKLGPNGQPIYNADGKVEKGPNYWKPEPLIRRLLEIFIRQSKTS